MQKVIEYKGHPKGVSFFIPVREFTEDVKKVEDIPDENGYSESEKQALWFEHEAEQQRLKDETNY